MKISFCTTCQNYTQYLKETYPKNLEVGKKYDCEFVLVNYNSQDDMDTWVKENLQKHIDSEYLIYYHDTESEGFNMSKSKNMSHELGTGDILINLDADNFLTKEYIDWIIDLFKSNLNVVTHGSGHGPGGRVAVWKEDYKAVGGYDELFEDSLYGIDHLKFCVNLKNMFGREIVITPRELCPYIEQTKKHRNLAKERSKLNKRKIC